MWGHEEELPPFTLYFPGWMAGRHEQIQQMCTENGVIRFAYQLVFTVPGISFPLYMNEIHEWNGSAWE